jgi:hypothetical protein
MRPTIRPLIALLALLVCVGLSTAQAPPLDLSTPPEALWTPAPKSAMDGALSNPIDLPSEHLHTDLLIGLPTGVRVQALLGDDGRHAFVAEVFAGLTIIFPTLGGGIRYRFTPLHDGSDVFRISPGIDGYGLFWSGGGDSYIGIQSGSAGVVTADVDFAWEHTWERLGAEVGLKVGVGAVFTNHETYPAPVLAFYGGFKF